MSVDHPPIYRDDPMSRGPVHLSRPRREQFICDMKAQQSAKIRQLGEALVASGIVMLDDQANALGLSRSTTWTILKGGHKASGLSADIINRMLAAPQLPLLVRAKVFEYLEEKMAGCYGHSQSVRRRFVGRLSAKWVDRLHFEEILESPNKQKVA